MTKTIPWNDGTSDVITVTYSGIGSEDVVVSSDYNYSSSERSKTITFETLSGSITADLVITQKGDIRVFDDTFDITFN